VIRSAGFFVLRAVLFSVLLHAGVCVQLAQGAPAVESLAESSAETEPSGWVILDQREGQGEQCLVCGQRMFGPDVVEVRYKGRIFHVAAGEMLGLFEQDPDRYFHKLQARAVLFDESSIDSGQMSFAWLGFGLYVLGGLIAGAACAYVAVAKGLRPAVWFFVGLLGNGLALAGVCCAKSRQDGTAPGGIPPGLAKVPTTRTPRRCEACGSENHPSAALCSGCGGKLVPMVESEVTLA